MPKKWLIVSVEEDIDGVLFLFQQYTFAPDRETAELNWLNYQVEEKQQLGSWNGILHSNPIDNIISFEVFA